MLREIRNQYQFLKSKFESVKFGPQMHYLLDKMRATAVAKINQRDQSSSEPLKWWVDIRMFRVRSTIIWRFL